ncbi:MAG TPA: class I SAM-dependent methyltransferase [Thermoplasmata archaeon]|nr:class I SAM-dependent methyltransferase [Thermoplasmata archaeon]
MADALVAGILVALLVGVAATLYFVFGSFLFGAGYQPTPARSAEAMLRLARVGPGDRVVDLGAGTGALVFRAAEGCGAEVVGVEVEPIRVAVLRLRRWLSPARRRITIEWGDLFRLDLSGATVVAAFLWPHAMGRLAPRLAAELRPGSRLVSHYHPLPGYRPAAVDDRAKVYLYVAPFERDPAGGGPGAAP